ncbi:futalosine hydrolase [Paenibacillus turicensis]|uniref:Futalosine hydrolase n=1 Tax=Paenibacillus turicensis TaxID=160487 RepID=A0ABS4FN83_9BACL|nr:futalosine hydrolase [Paenibacillus turicensis]MBP1904038.1 futalosine hydrolase [Paenibacillus turicensis]
MPFHRVLIMVAVEAEREMLLDVANPRVQIDVQLAGVGPIAAATNTAIQLTKQRYDLVISAGIGGGFNSKAHIGDLVIANTIISGDLGAQSEDGFLSLDKLGFGTNCISTPEGLATRIYNALSASSSLETRVHIGDIITLSTATGTLATAQQLANRYPNVYAEAMEGFGVAYAAHNAGIPVIELRSISNMVGPRQRDKWDIPTALRTLKQICSILPEVLLQ